MSSKALISPHTGPLLKRLEDLGIVDFYFTCFYYGQDRLAGICSSVRKKMSYVEVPPARMKAMHYVSTGNGCLMNMMELFFDFYAKQVPEFHCPPSFRLEAGPDNPMPMNRCQPLQNKMGIKSAAMFESRLEAKPNIIGMYILFSSLPQRQLEKQIEADRLRFEHELSQAHRLFQHEYPTLLNPWVNLNILPPTTWKIAKMVVNGYSTEEISKGLFLTKRGVDYHLDKLKAQFHAKNRSHLIAKLCFMDVINLEDVE